MTSYVELPALPVHRAADATCKVLKAQFETNLEKIRMAFGRPRTRFLGLVRIEATPEAVDKWLKEPGVERIAWDGKSTQFVTAYGLLMLATAAMQLGPQATVHVSHEDLKSIKDMYFSDEFNKLSQLAGMAFSKAALA
jgi:hypothetical protein